MENPFVQGDPMWWWYNLRLPILSAAATLAIVVAGFISTDRQPYGITVRVLLALGFLGTLPLGLISLGISFRAHEPTLTLISMLGTCVSLLVGYFHYKSENGLRGDFANFFARTADTATTGAAEPESQPVDSADVPSADATFAESPADDSGTTMDPGAATAIENVPTEVLPGAPAPPAWLVFKSGPNTGQTIPIADGATSIGRAPENDVVIDDDGVSRQHAEITFADGQYQLTDVGSAGGTIVEGSTAEATMVLDSGSELKVGETEVVFMQGQSPAAPSPTAPTGSGGAAATMIMQQPQEKLTAWLAVTSGPAKGQTSQINVGETRIGRGDDNHLRVNDGGVSRQHAVLIANEKGMTLLDLGSATGTTVNGQELSGSELTTTSVVTVGETDLMLVSVQQSENNTPIPTGAADATMVAGPAVSTGTGVLVVQKGPDAGKTFQLSDGDNVIGREDASVLLSDPAVSRKHAVVRKSGEKYVIYDLGSSAGTIVDGKKSQGAKIKGGDTIRLGASDIVVMDPTG